MTRLEALEQENAELKAHLEKLAYHYSACVENLGQFQELARERAEEIRWLRLDKENWRFEREDLLARLNQRATEQRAQGLCLCGCGQPVTQPKTGRKRKFSDATPKACSQRYYRQQKKLEKSRKFFRLKKPIEKR